MLPRKGYAQGPLGQTHYAELGAGSPLVLLGPAPRSHRFFLGLAEALSAGLRCVIVDQLGFGESAPLPKGGTIEDMADAVLPVLDALSIEKAHFFGLHSGLKVTAAFAVRHPGRVERIILCGKSHSIAPDMTVRNQATHAVVDRFYFTDGAGPSAGGSVERAWAAQWRNMTALWWSDELQKFDDPDRLMAEIELKVADDVLARRTVTESYHANFAFDLAAAVAKIEAPTTVIEITSAVEDRRIGRQGRALAALATNGRSLEMAETDPTGLLLYVGTERLAEEILRELRA